MEAFAKLYLKFKKKEVINCLRSECQNVSNLLFQHMKKKVKYLQLSGATHFIYLLLLRNNILLN